MEDSPQKNSTWRHIAILVIGLLVVAGLAIGMIAFLRTLFTPPPQQTETSAIPVGEIISSIKATDTIKAFENYQEQVTDSPSGQIIVTLEGKNYAITAQTKHTVLFFAKTPGQQGDFTTVEQQVTSFLEGKGYSKTENSGLAGASINPLYTTYKSNASICQLVSSQPASPESLAYHTFSCSENTTFSQEYTVIETLLALYKKENELPTFTGASRISKIEENKMLSFLTLNGESSTMLLFAAIDNNWEYIGNVGGEANSNGKYSISEEVRNKIDNSQWGDFLKKNLQ